MGKKLALLGSTVAALVLLAGTAASAAPANSFSNVTIANLQILGGKLQYHGQGALINVSTGSTMSQAGCHNESWLGGTEPVCEWKNAGGLCMDAGTSDALIRAEPCTGSFPQEWWTQGTGANGQYWLHNQHWSGVAGSNAFLVPTEDALGSDVGANYGAGFGNAAIWLIG